MSLLAGTAVLSYTDLYTSFTEVPGGLMVGQLMPGPAGKWFRLALVGGTDLVVGNALQSSVIDTQFTNMAVPSTSAAIFTGTAAAATTGITVTNGNTAVTANQFNGGSLSVFTTPDLGSEYTIISHTTATATGTLTLYLDRPIRNTWSTATKVNLRRSPWSGVIQSPITTLTGTPVGGAIATTASGTYGFVQTGGIGAALGDSTSILVGSAISLPSTIAAGAVTLNAAGFSEVGFAMQATSSGHCIAVQWQVF